LEGGDRSEGKKAHGKKFERKSALQKEQLQRGSFTLKEEGGKFIFRQDIQSRSSRDEKRGRNDLNKEIK